jgi:hypothetical protein
MRPFRSRVAAAVIFAILLLGMLGSAANAAGPVTNCFPEDPWPGLGSATPTSFPEDPWPGLTY